jgi:hypothetical protein
VLVQRITVTVNSRWRSKQTPIEVIVTRVTIRTVSYVAVHGAICGTLPRWQFVAEFQPVQERKKKGR